MGSGAPELDRPLLTSSAAGIKNSRASEALASGSPRKHQLDAQPRAGRRAAKAAAEPAQTMSVRLLLPDKSGHVGDQDVSAQIVQPSDALAATNPLAQRILLRSASKHPDCRSRTGAGVDHSDHIAAEVDRHQPPPGRGRDCWFVATPATRLPLLLRSFTGPDQKLAQRCSRARRARWFVKGEAF